MSTGNNETLEHLKREMIQLREQNKAQKELLEVQERLIKLYKEDVTILDRMLNNYTGKPEHRKWLTDKEVEKLSNYIEHIIEEGKKRYSKLNKQIEVAIHEQGII